MSASKIRTIILSFIVMIGIYSAYNIFFSDEFHSRSVFIFSAVTGFILELVIAIYSVGLTNYLKSRQNLSAYRFLIGLSIFCIAFARFYFRTAQNYPAIIIAEHLSLISFVWLVSGILSGIFVKYNGVKGIYLLLWQEIKNIVYFFLLSSFVAFYFTPALASPHRFFYHIFIYFIIALTVDFIVFISSRPHQSDEIDSSATGAPEINDDPLASIMKFSSNKYLMDNIEEISYSFNSKLRNIFLRRYPDVYSFLESSLELRSIDTNFAIAIRTNDIYNIEVLPENYLAFFCNLLEINNFRYLNRYFIEVNNKLRTGGIFIGSLEPTHLRFRHFIQKYPYYLGRILYFMDFLWRRVCPKLPITKYFYFAVTKGKSRAISLAESLGRLYYCGFEVLSIREIDKRVYFIAHKVGKPKDDTNPSYGPLFKMRRVGKDGKIIFVYKLRTMHPYSEYLQKFVYEHNSLEEGGKFHQDFRITSWGKFIRKIWVDELPMIFNWFKGDLKLVGVRPISQHYLSLYSQEVRERRVNYKPGLVPPFYADMPTTLAEIIQSEVKYMDAYDTSPFSTDVKYFFKAFKNIIFKRARSK
jgi:lipopolysaccharide/colanic/teichoic acid biosynthesis glycosyltransferase